MCAALVGVRTGAHVEAPEPRRPTGEPVHHDELVRLLELATLRTPAAWPTRPMRTSPPAYWTGPTAHRALARPTSPDTRPADCGRPSGGRLAGGALRPLATLDDRPQTDEFDCPRPIGNSSLASSATRLGHQSSPTATDVMKLYLPSRGPRQRRV